MKRVVLHSLWMGIIWGMWACSTDINITADWQEITIIYGLLDGADSTQYIRINKAFLSETTAAGVIGQIADSLYHQPDVQAVLHEFLPSDETATSDSLRLVQSTPLVKIDVATVGIEKEEGIFATTPHYLYQFDQTLQEKAIYQIEVITPTQQIVIAQTPIVNNFTLFDLADRDTLFLLEDLDHRLVWDRADHAAIYEGDLFIRLANIRQGTGEIIDTQTIKWNIFSNFKGDDPFERGRLDYNLEYERLVGTLASRIPPDIDPTIQRSILSADLVIYAGSEILENFFLINLAQFGVVSTQPQPHYTNVENGLGIFSSRYTKQVHQLCLHPRTHKSLICDPLLAHLRLIYPVGGEPCR